MQRRLESLARAEHLLIGCDFDGTIAPIAPRPDLAWACPKVLDALRRAAFLPRTSVAIVSGRSMTDLRSRLGNTNGLWLVGGHGASISGPGFEKVPDDVSAQLDVVARLLLRSAPEKLGFVHERKPTGIAVHYRSVTPAEAERVVPMLAYAIAIPAGLRIRHGKMVIEFQAVDTDKGRALTAIKDFVGATGVAFLGDDHTDEDAFRVLGPLDAAIKVGSHDSHAEFAADTVEDAQRIIIDLVRQREEIVLAESG